MGMLAESQEVMQLNSDISYLYIYYNFDEENNKVVGRNLWRKSIQIDQSKEKEEVVKDWDVG